MKKFFSAVLSLAMMASFAVTSYAETEYIFEMKDAYNVNGAEFAAGDIVKVDIAQNETAEISANGWILNVAFDKDVLEFVDIKDTTDTSFTAAADFEIGYLNNRGKIKALEYTIPCTKDGANSLGVVGLAIGETANRTYAFNDEYPILGTVEFKVKEGAAAGTYALKCTQSATYDDGAGNVAAVLYNNAETGSISYTVKDAAPADVKVTGITATPAELKALTVGDKGTIAVAVAPADATEKGVTFVSDAEDVISVDADGNYEAKSAGTAKITITAKDGSGVTATVEVSVSAPVIPEPDKVQFVKAVKSDKAATGYWVFKVNKGITETLKVTYANAADAEEKLELDAPAAIGGESDVTFALYLTVTGDRVGKAYTAAVAHGTDSATGTAITLD